MKDVSKKKLNCSQSLILGTFGDATLDGQVSKKLFDVLFIHLCRVNPVAAASAMIAEELIDPSAVSGDRAFRESPHFACRFVLFQQLHEAVSRCKNCWFSFAPVARHFTAEFVGKNLPSRLPTFAFISTILQDKQELGVMDTAPIVTRLWDYGWLCHDTVQLSAAVSDLELLQQYVASPAFHTSFLPSDKDETGIHGPFVAGRIHAEDYIPLRETDLESYLASVELSETEGDDVAERAKLLPHLRSAFAEGRTCYVLRRDERDKELFHDWGFVLFVFREFLFAGPQRDGLERFVIGYD